MVAHISWVSILATKIQSTNTVYITLYMCVGQFANSGQSVLLGVFRIVSSYTYIEMAKKHLTSSMEGWLWKCGDRWWRGNQGMFGAVPYRGHLMSIAFRVILVHSIQLSTFAHALGKSLVYLLQNRFWTEEMQFLACIAFVIVSFRPLIFSNLPADNLIPCTLSQFKNTLRRHLRPWAASSFVICWMVTVVQYFSRMMFPIGIYHSWGFKHVCWRNKPDAQAVQL